MRDTERERGRDTGREKQAPGREPDVGLDPESPGSHPGPKAGVKPLYHPGIPEVFYFLTSIRVILTKKGTLIQEEHKNEESYYL